MKFIPSSASDVLYVTGDHIDDAHPHGDLDRIMYVNRLPTSGGAIYGSIPVLFANQIAHRANVNNYLRKIHYWKFKDHVHTEMTHVSDIILFDYKFTSSIRADFISGMYTAFEKQYSRTLTNFLDSGFYNAKKEIYSGEDETRADTVIRVLGLGRRSDSVPFSSFGLTKVKSGDPVKAEHVAKYNEPLQDVLNYVGEDEYPRQQDYVDSSANDSKADWQSVVKLEQSGDETDMLQRCGRTFYRWDYDEDTKTYMKAATQWCGLHENVKIVDVETDGVAKMSAAVYYLVDVSTAIDNYDGTYTRQSFITHAWKGFDCVNDGNGRFTLSGDKVLTKDIIDEICSAVGAWSIYDDTYSQTCSVNPISCVPVVQFTKPSISA